MGSSMRNEEHDCGRTCLCDNLVTAQQNQIALTECRSAKQYARHCITEDLLKTMQIEPRLSTIAFKKIYYFPGLMNINNPLMNLKHILLKNLF